MLTTQDHLVDGIVAHEQLPRYFGKSGPTDADPRKTKKDGGGKANWGRSGDESQDCGYTFTNNRRRSNSSTQGLTDFTTKFEIAEPEPVFEEQLHDTPDVNVAKEIAVTKVDSTSSSNESETDQGSIKY
ncbi:hypothetical protein N7520_010728 [Penicillium odoratum]|uniref:uncharacterized protein n=1 Tax=Penicillium odoratum TaxID=1167516 RepID=UPI0025494245|nr:uncharacterized protein N7520_010728 [Penicillium odoratum]KAJ5745546.1 hypothetical protein N7520_010728 [Penicillium odoratum]